ncbi:MAG: class I SAM-dependent methyltransferase [Verrucomicrobia bacterium]|nr:class I SAM-dependent methyltransferase [Verrucomicrobiota bacterium]
MSQVALHSTRCAICHTEGNATELYPANFDFSDFNPDIFSARRLPDRIHYRMVKCNACDLVRSDPVADDTTLGELYRQSTFDYGTEVANLRRTYGRYLDRLDALGGSKSSLLEIGCGNGFFLEEAQARGCADVRGVEPSSQAVAKAAPGIRERIVCDMMRPGLFAEASFDVVCLFQVFDHLPNPAGVLAEAFNVLKPGGFVLILNHNINALSARLLGERSPIIDIEHTYLYNPATLSRLAHAQKFTVRETGSVWNYYTVHYLAHLIPFPNTVKTWLLALLTRSLIGRLPLSMPLGNCYIIAQKPE